MIDKKIDTGEWQKRATDVSISGELFSDILKGMLIERKSNIRFQARGFSMAPFIKDRDIVTVVPVLPGHVINFGDLVVINKDNPANKIILHRIVGRSAGLYLIKGDNHYTKDGLVPIGTIFGKVIKMERNGKRVFFGFGPERFIIAFLSRCNLLIPLLFPLRIPTRFVRKRLWGLIDSCEIKR